MPKQSSVTSVTQQSGSKASQHAGGAPPRPISKTPRPQSKTPRLQESGLRSISPLRPLTAGRQSSSFSGCVLSPFFFSPLFSLYLFTLSFPLPLFSFFTLSLSPSFSIFCILNVYLLMQDCKLDCCDNITHYMHVYKSAHSSVA